MGRLVVEQFTAKLYDEEDDLVDETEVPEDNEDLAISLFRKLGRKVTEFHAVLIDSTPLIVDEETYYNSGMTNKILRRLPDAKTEDQ